MINSGRVYATTDGDIGFIILGRQVERQNSENSAFLQNGQDSMNEWLKFLDTSKLPSVKNP